MESINTMKKRRNQMQKEISICMWIHNWFNFLHVFSPAKAFHHFELFERSSSQNAGKNWFWGAKNCLFPSNRNACGAPAFLRDVTRQNSFAAITQAYQARLKDVHKSWFIQERAAFPERERLLDVAKPQLHSSASAAAPESTAASISYAEHFRE